jgi:hypothetical protein
LHRGEVFRPTLAGQWNRPGFPAPFTDGNDRYPERDGGSDDGVCPGRLVPRTDPRRRPEARGMEYVDGFIIVQPEEKLPAHREMA